MVAAQPAQNVAGAKMFDFRRITLFCLGYRLPKHKMTIYAKNVVGYAPCAPLATPMLHADCKRVCWVPAFNIMNNSDGISILDLEASSGSGAGGEVVGYKPTSKGFDMSKIRSKSLKIRAKSSKMWAQVFRHFCSRCMMNETDCRNMSEFDFFFSKYTWRPLRPLRPFLCDFQNKSIIFESQIFRVRLSKFGQKSFTLPNICLSLHFVVSRPISASLSLDGFKSRLGLEGYRLWPQTYCLVTLNTATIWLSKTSLIQPLRSWNAFSLLYLQVRNNIQ